MNAAPHKTTDLNVADTVEQSVAAAVQENAVLQTDLSDRVSLCDYTALARRHNGASIWTEALQRAVDEHEIVVLPPSDEPYLVNGTIILPSNRRIEATGATVRMADGMKTVLFRNANAADGTFAPVQSGSRDTNIAIVGGTWEDCCTRRAGYGTSGMFNLLPRRHGNFFGVSAMMFFGNCDHVSVVGATFRHAGAFAIQVGDGDAFRFEDISFDHCFADGLHLNGNLSRVLARRIRGQVGDDLVALNAYDWLNSSVSFGPQRDILCEDLELVRTPGFRVYPAIRIQPAKYRYADGTTVDCSVSNAVFRRVRGITTFKCYLQTPPYKIGKMPEWGETGSGGNLVFEDIEIDLTGPIDNIGQYASSDPVRGHFGAFEIGAHLSSVELRDIDVTFHADRYPLSHLVTVGPKSCVLPQNDEKGAMEVFDPYVKCHVEKMSLANVRVRGTTPGELVHVTAFDDVNGDGRSSGQGEIGRIIRRVDATGSTNADLARLANEDPALPDGFVLHADIQTAGKGRQGRVWTSPPLSGLTFSVLLKPDVPPLRASTLPLVVGLAVAQAVARLLSGESKIKGRRSTADSRQPIAGQRVGLKWPNDIQIDGCKLCGILCEMRAEDDHVRHIVAGIGLNVNLAEDEMPTDIVAIATSLRIAAGHPFDRDEVLDAILLSLEENYRLWLARGFDSLRSEISKFDILRDRPVTIERGANTISGIANGIAPDGALLVLKSDGTIEPVYSGDAHIGMHNAQCTMLNGAR